MNVLYQIGDLPLFNALVGGNDDPIELELSYGWRTPSTTFQQHGGVRYSMPAARGLYEPVKLKVKGFLKATSYTTPSRLKSRIRSFAGRRNLPFIIMRLEEDNDLCPAQITWLLGYGILDDDEDNVSYGSSDSTGAFTMQEIGISIEITEPLQQLPQSFWEYRHYQERLLNTYSDAASPAGLNGFYQPLLLSQVKPDYYFVKWQDSETLLDTEYWSLAYLNQMALGGIGSDFIEPTAPIHLYANEDLWAVPPRALYAITNLVPFGSVAIATTFKDGLYYSETRTNTSVLDVEQLDLDLTAAGYGGLGLDDIVYTGDFAVQPGFIMRNGIELEAVRPRWSYEGLYPGDVPLGYSIITFTKYLNDAQFAYLYTFETR